MHPHRNGTCGHAACRVPVLLAGGQDTAQAQRGRTGLRTPRSLIIVLSITQCPPPPGCRLPESPDFHSHHRCLELSCVLSRLGFSNTWHLTAGTSLFCIFHFRHLHENCVFSTGLLAMVLPKGFD